jgi:hypothetical protein
MRRAPELATMRGQERACATTESAEHQRWIESGWGEKLCPAATLYGSFGSGILRGLHLRHLADGVGHVTELG